MKITWGWIIEGIFVIMISILLVKTILFAKNNPKTSKSIVTNRISVANGGNYVIILNDDQEAMPGVGGLLRIDIIKGDSVWVNSVEETE